MQYELKGGNFPVVVCQLASGEQMITEKGSMVWISPNMEMKTAGGGLGKMFSRAFSGDSHVPEHLHRPGRAGNDRLRLQLPWKNPARDHRPGPGDGPAEECFPGL